MQRKIKRISFPTGSPRPLSAFLLPTRDVCAAYMSYAVPVLGLVGRLDRRDKLEKASLLRNVASYSNLQGFDRHRPGECIILYESVIGCIDTQDSGLHILTFNQLSVKMLNYKQKGIIQLKIKVL